MLALFGNILVRLLMMWLAKAQADAEAKRRFLYFMDYMRSLGLVSVALTDDYARQVRELGASDKN